MADVVIVGRRFGKLVVIKFAGQQPGKHKYWMCRCDCGREMKVRDNTLKSETRACRRCSKITHGLSRSYIHVCWGMMLSRCYRKSHQDYENYGGRGIRVCRRWRFGEENMTGVECFLEDMGHRPTARHTLDRRDVNGHYSPDNCHWATYRTQVNNRRVTRRVLFQGRQVALTKACELAAIKYHDVDNRRRSLGVSLQEAFDWICANSHTLRRVG